MNFQNSQPTGLLPPLSTLGRLPLDERKLALEGWVAWFNTNRHRVSGELERELDVALWELQQESVHAAELSELDARFSAWLDHAGKVGEGHGPAHDVHDV